MMQLLLALVIAVRLVSAAELVRDEPTRLKVLAAVFPGGSITATPTRHIDTSGHSSFGRAEFDTVDPLGNEMVYRITGSPRGGTERCASEDVVSGKKSNVREGRSRIYRIANSRFVAVSQYSFLGVEPAGACLSIARISLVGVRPGQFLELSSFEPNT